MASTAAPPHTLTSLTAAARLVLGSDLGQRALRKGQEKVTLMQDSVGAFSTVLVGAIVAAVDTQHALTQTGAVFLTGVLEYMATVLVELAGNEVIGDKLNTDLTIDVHQVMKAVRSDEALDMQFPGVFLNAGREQLPKILPKVLNDLKDSQKQTMSDEVRSFKARMTEASMKDEISLDLRGHHHARPEGARRDTFKLVRAQIFDVVSPLNQKARQDEYFNDLCKTDQRVAKGIETDPSNSSERLEQIRTMQQTQESCFCPTDFRSMVHEIARDFHSEVHFTHDAVDAIQQTTEAYLVKVIAEANSCAHHAGRVVLQQHDLAFAHRM